MEKEKINELQGKQIEILEFHLIKETDVTITCKFLIEKKIFFLRFSDVSSLNISDFSFPLELCGFEILCSKECGWEEDFSYFVHDFEDERMSFYCKSIEILS